MNSKSTRPAVAVMVPIGILRPAEYNPRTMSDIDMDALCESLRRFGFAVPIVVNSRKGRENVVVGGHQRLKAAETVGMKEVPAVYVDLTERQERELNLRLNRNTGRWDWEALSEMDAALLLDAGFTEVELARNGAGGMGIEVESASGSKRMSLTIAFRTPEELEGAAAHFTGRDLVARTRKLIRAWRVGKV